MDTQESVFPRSGEQMGRPSCSLGRPGCFGMGFWLFDWVDRLAFVFEGEEEDPAVGDEVADAGVSFEDGGDAGARGLNHDVEAEGFVDPLLAVVDGLHGEAGLEVADVALADAEGAGDVVGDFVSAAEDCVVHG